MLSLDRAFLPWNFLCGCSCSFSTPIACTSKVISPPSPLAWRFSGMRSSIRLLAPFQIVFRAVGATANRFWLPVPC